MFVVRFTLRVSHKWHRVQSCNFCREVVFIRSGLFAKVSKKADKLKHHVVTQGMWLEKEHGGKWLKNKGERRKKLYLQYTGILPLVVALWF